MLKEVLLSPWNAAGIVLITQIIFIYLRTLNVIYTADRKMIPSIVTGAGIGITWLISIAIGANSLLNGEWQPLIAHVVGGALGTYWGIKTEERKQKRLENNDD